MNTATATPQAQSPFPLPKGAMSSTKAVKKPKISCLEMMKTILVSGASYSVSEVNTLLTPKGYKLDNISNAFYRLRDLGHLVQSPDGRYTFKAKVQTAKKAKPKSTAKAKPAVKKAKPKSTAKAKPATSKKPAVIKKATPKAKTATVTKKPRTAVKKTRPGSIKAQAAKSNKTHITGAGTRPRGIKVQIGGKLMTLADARKQYDQLSQLFSQL